MSRLIVEIDGPDIDRTSGRADQFWRNRYASSLRTIADCMQTGRTEGDVNVGELQGSFRFELATPADEAA